MLPQNVRDGPTIVQLYLWQSLTFPQSLNSDLTDLYFKMREGGRGKSHALDSLSIEIEGPAKLKVIICTVFYSSLSDFLSNICAVGVSIHYFKMQRLKVREVM